MMSLLFDAVQWTQNEYHSIFTYVLYRVADAFPITVAHLREGYDWTSKFLGQVKVKDEKTGTEKGESIIQFVNWGYAAEVDGFKPLNVAVQRESKKLKKLLDPYIYETNQAYSVDLYLATLLAGGDHTSDKLNGARILEVGCGRGGGSLVLHALCEPKYYMGVDIACSSIEQCNAAFRAKNREFAIADATNLEAVLDASSFDVVFNVESSHCYPDFPRFLEGVYRVLAPGGTFLWADQRMSGKVIHSLNMDYCYECFKEAGFVMEQKYDIRANVCEALKKGSLDCYIEKGLTASGLDWARFKLYLWCGALSRPKLLMDKCMTYHLVVLHKPSRKAVE